MKWLEDPPEDWTDAPDHPPAQTAGEFDAETYPDGVMIHEGERPDDGSFIYAWEGDRSLDDCT